MSARDYRENGECWNCGCCADPGCCDDSQRCIRSDPMADPGAMGFVVFADELNGRSSFQWTWEALRDALAWHLPYVRQYHGPLVGTLQAEETNDARVACFVRFKPGEPE